MDTSTETLSSIARIRNRPETSSATPGSLRNRSPANGSNEHDKINWTPFTLREEKERDALSPGTLHDDELAEFQDTPLQSRPWSPASRSSTVLEPLLGTTARRRPPRVPARLLASSSGTLASSTTMSKSKSKESLRQRRKRLAKSPARARAINSCVSALSRSAAHLKLAYASSSSPHASSAVRPKTATASTLASTQRRNGSLSSSFDFAGSRSRPKTAFSPARGHGRGQVRGKRAGFNGPTLASANKMSGGIGEVIQILEDGQVEESNKPIVRSYKMWKRKIKPRLQAKERRTAAAFSLQATLMGPMKVAGELRQPRDTTSIYLKGSTVLRKTDLSQSNLHEILNRKGREAATRASRREKTANWLVFHVGCSRRVFSTISHR